MDIDDEYGYVLVEENIKSKDNIIYDQVNASVCADTKHTTTSTVTRETNKDNKTKLIIAIVVIVLVLSAICACTIYMLIELSRLKSEISSRNMISSQTMNSSLDVLHRQINDLVGTLNTSIEKIEVRENGKQVITNASLDVLLP